MKPSRNGARDLVVVVYPHSDDAALSLGGTLLGWKKSRRLVLVCVFTKFLWTVRQKPGRFSIPQATLERLAEERRFVRRVGARWIGLGFEEAPIRLGLHKKAGQSFQKAYKRLFGTPDAALVRRLAQKLERVVSRLSPDTLFAPLGLGRHKDHVAVREACLRLVKELRQDRWSGEACLYEDLPYGLYDRRESSRLLKGLGKKGWTTRSHAQDITRENSRKQSALRLYKSQFRDDSMFRRISAYSRGLGHGRSYRERWWRLGRREVPSS